MKKTNLKMGLVLLLATMLMPCSIHAQDKVEASVGADFVSSYLWRGQDLGGVSIQPSISLDYKGFTLEAWGSVGFDSEDDKELDLTLAYTTGGFSASVTDYWFTGGPGYFHYSSGDTNHVFEAQVGYDFGPVALNWYTNFAGADGLNKDGERAYSSYVTLAAPFTLGGLDWMAEVGATPWATDYYEANGFAIVDVSLEVEKEIKITDSFSLPLFAKIAWNPRSEAAHFAVGLSF